MYDCPVFNYLAFILPGCPLTFELWRRRPGQDAELVRAFVFLVRDSIKGQSVTTLHRCLCRSVKTSALNIDTQNLETIPERRLDLNFPVVTLSPDVQSVWRDLILLLIFNPVTFNPPKSKGPILEALRRADFVRAVKTKERCRSDATAHEISLDTGCNLATVVFACSCGYACFCCLVVRLSCFLQCNASESSKKVK